MLSAVNVRRVSAMFSLLAGSFLCAGCDSDDGGGGSGGTPFSFSDPNATMTIGSFEVTGTSPPLASGVRPIESKLPTTNPGQFSMDWKVTGNNVYTGEVYVSEDNTLDITGVLDIKIMGCGAPVSANSCQAVATYTCDFEYTASIKGITCNYPSGGTYTSADLNSFLGAGTSKSAYLILRACNPAGTSCPTKSVRVEFVY